MSLRDVAYNELDIIIDGGVYNHGSIISESANDDVEYMIIAEGFSGGFDVFIRIEVSFDFDGDVEVSAYIKHDVDGGEWDVI